MPNLSPPSWRIPIPVSELSQRPVWVESRGQKTLERMLESDSPADQRSSAPSVGQVAPISLGGI